MTAAKDCTDVNEFVRSFASRLQGIARANSVLTCHAWQGASLMELLKQALVPYEDAHGRVELEGPKVWLPAQKSLGLTLTFHELATNAAKYGALSRAEGRLLVQWVVEDKNVELIWIEQDGAPVVVPTKSGFGTCLIHVNVEQQLQGKLHVVWAERGLTIRIAFPLPVAR